MTQQQERKTRIGKRVKAAIDLMVHSAQKRDLAADEVGLHRDSLRKAFKRPDVLAYLREQQEVLRTSASARSIARVDKLADSAESEHVRYKANELLLGIDGIVPLSRSENVHIHQGVSPGLVIVYGDTPPELLTDITPHPAMRGRVIEARARELALIETKREGEE